MGRCLPRHLGPLYALDQGHWSEDRGHVFVRCPECGGVHEVDVEVIGKGGRVWGRWTCPTVTCAFSDFLELESWAC